MICNCGYFYIQSNRNSSNTDGLFAMANSNSFLSACKTLPIVQENKYFSKFSYFIMKLYVVLLIIIDSRWEDFPKLLPFTSWPGAVINPQWLELPISRTNLHGPKDVRAIEVRLYLRYYVSKKESDSSTYQFKDKTVIPSIPGYSSNSESTIICSKYNKPNPNTIFNNKLILDLEIDIFLCLFAEIMGLKILLSISRTFIITKIRQYF